MGSIRVIVHGTATDHERFKDVAQRVCDLVAANEPDTLQYECFVDDGTAQFVWHELYKDDAAFLAHSRNLVTTGVVAELGKVARFEGTMVLGEVTDPAARQTLTKFGATFFEPAAGMVR